MIAEFQFLKGAIKGDLVLRDQPLFNGISILERCD